MIQDLTFQALEVRCIQPIFRSHLTVDIMAVRKRFVNPFARRASAEELPATGAPDMEASADSKFASEKSHETDQASLDTEIVDQKAQSGTQKAQASTQAWTKNTLIAAYAL